MVTIDDVVGLIKSLGKKVAIEQAKKYESVGVVDMVSNDNGILVTLVDNSTIQLDVDGWYNLTPVQRDTLAKLIPIGNDNGATYIGGDLAHYPTNFNETNDNKSFKFLASNFTKVSDNEYHINIKHGLNDLNCIPTIVNDINEGCTEGWKIIDADNIRIIATAPFSGRLLINFSCSNGTRINNIASVKSSYIFKNTTERDTYFSASLESLQNGLVIIVKDVNSPTFLYTWYGEDKPSLYSNLLWDDTTALIKGERGEVGLKPSHKIENNKIYFENPDGTFDSGLEINGTIDISKFTEFLKDFTGSNLQDLANFLDTHKTFLNGLFIGDEEIDGSFKIVNNNSKLEYQRLENGVWKTIGTIGSYTTDIVNLDSPYSTVNFKTPTRDLNLARITTDGNSVQIGDVRLDRLILSGKELYSQKIEDTKTSYNYIVNNDTSLNQNVTTWDFIVNIPSQNNYSYYALHAVEIDNTTLGYYKYTITDVLSGNVVYYTGSDFELKQGLTYQFKVTGLHTETLPKLVHLTCGRQYKITFTAQNSIGFRGGLIGGNFKPYLVLKYYFAEEDKLLSKGNMTDSISSNSSTSVASSKAVYTLSQAINSISGGMSPIIPISCEDFSVLENGTNGVHYILTNDGAINGETVHKLDNIFMVNTFTDRTITSSDYVLIPVNSNAKGNIYITNVEPMNGSKNVVKTMNNYPNEGSVLSAMSDDNSYKITCEWDRGEEFCGQPTINGKDVIGIANKGGGTFTGYVVLNSMDIINNKITAILNTNTYTIAFSIITPPSISSITFGSLPNGQTELKEGDIIDVTIVSDKPINTVEFQDTGAFKYQLLSVASGTTVTINGIIANRGTTLQNLTGSIRIKSTEGSWSGITESVSTLSLNNTNPSININSISYPIGQQALKDTESATINFTLSDTDVCNASIIGDDLSLGTKTSTSLDVTRLNTGTTTYNDGSSNNVSFTLTRNANGSSINYSIGVSIVTVNPSIIVPNTLKLTSGSGTQSQIVNFNQKVLVSSITAPIVNLGNLVSLTTSDYEKSYNWQMSSVDTDNKSTNILNINATIKGMSGLTSDIQLPYILAGFSLRTLTLTYNTLDISLPCNVVEEGNLIVTNGFINSTPAFQIMKRKVDYVNIGSELVDAWAYNNGKIYLPKSVFDFGYNSSNNISFQIQETN